MTYRLVKTWSDPHMQKLAVWTCRMMNAVGATAAQIGCSKEAVVGQAALETGWGAAVVGQHNLFGIKATNDWTGLRITVLTREVISGQSVMMNQVFRDYATDEESMEDHFQFLKRNTRYADVFDPNNAFDDDEYFRRLAKDGYATDPNYAQALHGMLTSVKLLTAGMVDDTAAAPAPVAPPVGYVQTETGNIIRQDVSQSEIVKGADIATKVAVAVPAVTAVSGTAASVAGMDWKTMAALAAVVLACALGFAIYKLVQIKAARIEMSKQGIA